MRLTSSFKWDGFVMLGPVSNKKVLVGCVGLGRVLGRDICLATNVHDDVTVKRRLENLKAVTPQLRRVAAASAEPETALQAFKAISPTVSGGA